MRYMRNLDRLDVRSLSHELLKDIMRYMRNLDRLDVGSLSHELLNGHNAIHV